MASRMRQVDWAVCVGHNHDVVLLCPSLNSQGAGVSSSLAQRGKPFANDSDSEGHDGLTVENCTDSIALYGRIRLTRDKKGLEHARWLRDLAASVVAELEAASDLPESVPPPKPTGTKRNPFA
jgi:hypothetical protein